MRCSLSFALCLPASRRLENIKLRRSLRPGFFFRVIPPKFFATGPRPLALHSRLYPPQRANTSCVSGSPRAKHGTQYLFYRLPAALCLPTSHQELGNYTSRLILSFLRFLARWPGWYGIAVLPYFSASGKVPVTHCGLPLRGTYAAYWPSCRFNYHITDCCFTYAAPLR